MAIPKTKHLKTLLKLGALLACVVAAIQVFNFTVFIVWHRRRIFDLRTLYYGESADLSPHLPLVLDFTPASGGVSKQPACVLQRSDVSKFIITTHKASVPLTDYKRIGGSAVADLTG